MKQDFLKSVVELIPIGSANWRRNIGNYVKLIKIQRHEKSNYFINPKFYWT